MPAQVKNAPSKRTRTRRTSKPTPPPTSDVAQPSAGRAADGRFAAGNAGGPGNPHARHCARMLALLRVTISDEEMVAIIRALVDKARDGDVSAAKLIMSYKLGKPAPAPNPDEIDRDEWEHYQRDTIQLQDVQQVLGSLPSCVGNNLARTALPVMSQAGKQAIASQLAKNGPAARKVAKDNEVANEQAQEGAPIPIGNSGANSSPSNRDPRFTNNDQRSTTNDSASPIPNRKSDTSRSGKAKPKKVKRHWVQQVARKSR